MTDCETWPVASSLGQALPRSLNPPIPTGSQIVVKHIEGQDDAAELLEGDVVTFMPNPDDQTLVTHRVVEIAVKADNSRVFTTKGDNNNTVDPDTITAMQLRGEVQYHVPYAGYLSNLLNAQQQAADVVVVAVALILAIVFVLSLAMSAAFADSSRWLAFSHAGHMFTPAPPQDVFNRATFIIRSKPQIVDRSGSAADLEAVIISVGTTPTAQTRATGAPVAEGGTVVVLGPYTGIDWYLRYVVVTGLVACLAGALTLVVARR